VKVGRARIELVEQGELQWPGVTGGYGDLRCPEAAESVEPGWNQFLAPRDARTPAQLGLCCRFCNWLDTNQAHRQTPRLDPA
jgi:hypothetical protein